MDQTAKTNQDLLLVIDMQNVYTKGQEWACEEVEKASDSILRLLNSRALSQVIRKTRKSRPTRVFRNSAAITAGQAPDGYPSAF